MKKFLLLLLIILGIVGSSFAQAAPPDRDGDGVPDSRDNCDSDVGPAGNNGCPVTSRATDVPPPDSDGDGTADPLDRCPTEAGDGANGGCPAGQTGTVTTSPTSAPELPLAAAPTAGDCVVSTQGSTPVNIRQYPTLEAEVVGTIDPNEWVVVLARYDNTNLVFSQNGMGGNLPPEHQFPLLGEALDPNYPVWFLVQDNDSVAIGWVAQAVLRTGGDCSEFVNQNPNPDAVYLQYKLIDSLVSSATGESTADDTHKDWIEIESFGWGMSPVPVFPTDNPFIAIPLDPQEAHVDYFLKLDGIDGESSSSRPMEQMSLNYARLEGDNCELVLNSDGTIDPVCDDGGTPPSVIICTYQEFEAGVFSEVCYEVEIPEGCVVDSPEAGIWHVTCEDDGDGVQVTPLGETDPILDITWGEGTVQVGLLLPAVQKVREAASRIRS